MRHKIKFLLMAVILTGLTALASAVSNIYVAIDGVDNDDPGRGQSWDLSYATISNGIAHSSTVGDTVLVSNGTYNAPVSAYGLLISKGVIVKSFNGTGVTFIGGTYPDATNRCVTLNHVSAVLSGFTITNGWCSRDSGTHRYGGGVSIGGDYGSGGMLTNCIVTRCVASIGGGVAICTGEVRNCVITENYTTNRTNPSGGGLCTWGSYGGGAGIYDSIIINNTSEYDGAGVLAQSTWGIISNCVIAGNYAKGGNPGGSGVRIQVCNAWMRFKNCVISNNISTNAHGGGIGFTGGGAMFQDCDIVWNRSYSGGGGIYRSYSMTTPCLFSNCFIAYNRAAGNGGGIGGDDYGWPAKQFDFVDCRVIANTGANGGGIYFRGWSSLSRCQVVSNYGSSSAGGMYIVQSSNSIRNCLVYGNNGGILFKSDGATSLVDSCTIANNGYGIAFDSTITTNVAVSNSVIWGNGISGWSDHSNQFYYSCSTGINFSQGNITNDPLFMESNAANYRLTARSPCVNAGFNNDWMTNFIDLDRGLRIRYGRVDMGVYEVIYSGVLFTFY